MKNTHTKILVHHSADASTADQVNKIDDWHKHREFPLSSLGFYVGYHYVINHEGKVTQTRRDDEEGAHCRGMNFESIGICLEGNFENSEPTQAQKMALGSLLARLCATYNLNVTDIYPHRAFGTTSCYGGNLDDNFARVLFLDYKVHDLTKTPSCESSSLK